MQGLHISNLTAGVRGVNYLTNISLNVNIGEAFVLIGKDSDRRLALRVIRECARGKIGFVENGDVIARVKSGESALVIEGDNLYTFMSASQYMLYTAGAIKMPKPEKLTRIAECLELVGLTGKEKTKIAKLDRTERCALSIACGMFTKPDVLLLCLDDLHYSRTAHDRINKTITKIKESGVAILACLTDSRLVGEGFDTIGLMEKGILKETGTSDDIISKYSYCVYSVKSDRVNIKRLANKFAELRSIIKVKPHGGTLYLYSLDKQRTGIEMLKAIGEDTSIEAMRMVSPTLTDAIKARNSRA